MPVLAVTVEPKAADPVIVGAAVKVGTCVVAVVATDHKSVVPMAFALIVLAVMNLPASSGVWVYVVFTAPRISEHWEGWFAVGRETAVVQLNHWCEIVGSG